MGRRKLKNKKILIIILIILLVIVVGFAIYVMYGFYKIKQLSEMTFEEMLSYTTEDNGDALITVGIIKNGEMTYTVYGENGTILPQEEYIYEIGSITKTFTTSLLSKAISEGRISLEDTIDKYIELPKKDYYTTIKRLVTHTSGYKAFYFEKPMIFNFLNGENDFNGISEEMIRSRLGKINLEDKDYQFNYSNFGMAVLGLVLEEVYGRDYTHLMNDYSKNDLGLLNTKILHENADLENYWKWTEDDGYIPAGAILSNITDVMEYAHMHMIGNPEYLSGTHQVLAQIDTANSTNELMGIHMNGVGSGWIIDNDNEIIWHNGATRNYNSYLGFNKEKQIGVVILSNLAPDHRIPATIIGIELLTSE
ncbi:MAG TPA: beta-lactamase family protein [Clostridiales bacterium]|nr:beta-lactamase family protein [Clostridiales bacterium]